MCSWPPHLDRMSPVIARSGNGIKEFSVRIIHMPKRVSVVLPFFNEERNLPVLHERLRQVIRALPYQFELVFVNDGSRDGSKQFLLGQIRAHPDIRLIDLSRN